MSSNKYKTLFSNTLLISLGTFGSKLLVFLMVRFYTSYLTPSDYSTADLITQTANLLFPLISIGITEGVFRFALDGAENRKSVFTIGLAAISIGGLLFFAIAPLLGLVKDFGGYVWLIIVYTMAASYHALCTQYIRAVGKTGLFAIQGIINTILVILLNILFLAAFNMGITGYVLSVVVADTLCTLFLVVKEKLWRAVTLHPDMSVLPDMLKYSIPLIPTTVFWWITSVSDRYMVNWFIGSAENGLYAISYKLPTVLSLVSGIFMKAWQFSAVTEDDGNKQDYINFFSRIWSSFQAVMFIAGSFMIVLAKPAIKLLTTKQFYGAWEYVPLLSAAMVFSAFDSFMGTVYTVNKKSINSFFTSFAGAALNVALNFLLIPLIGVQGAAIATVVSYFTVFIIRAINARQYIPFKLYFGNVAINTALIAVQILVLVFGVTGWVVIEILLTVILIATNFKFLIPFITKIFSFLKRRNKNA